MFKRAVQTIRPCSRHVHQQASGSVQKRYRRATIAATVFGVGFTVGSVLLYYNDLKTAKKDADASAGLKVATPFKQAGKPNTVDANLWEDLDTLRSLVWGSNRNGTLESCQTLDKETSWNASIKSPKIARWLDNVALRDLALHRTHAACVDARGDVYQWGDGFFKPALERGGKPVPTLRGKNIVKLQLTTDKVYALSASGKVYVLAADVLEQVPPANPPSNSSWRGTGWIWKDYTNVRCVALDPKEKLGWGEKFTSIAAGDNHLLALTNQGRTFAHPVNKDANRSGQLGFKNFQVPDPAAQIMGTEPKSLRVELLPKTIEDPLDKSARSIRVTPSTDVATDLSNIEDSSIHWCTQLYEIPVLRGVEVSQIAAGSRSSFVRTPNGRVLGWGANEHGQIGLGDNVTLETITVPTEVVLWRMIPSGVASKCINVAAGGDLTSFIMERRSPETSITLDLLMCGNGQNGGLGNQTYSTSQGSPVRVKSLSGLSQYSDSTKRLEPIVPTEVVISPTGHILVTLDSSAESHGVGGQDLMVWGKNYDYELGNGKKASLALPVNLDAPDGQRLMLVKRKAREVLDLAGKVWKRNVPVEQHAVAGYGNSAVYWKIVD